MTAHGDILRAQIAQAPQRPRVRMVKTTAGGGPHQREFRATRRGWWYA